MMYYIEQFVRNSIIGAHLTVEFTTTVLNQIFKKVSKDLKYRATIHSDDGVY